MILLKIAARNLRAYKTKTLIVGTLIALGTAVLVLGNSVVTTITDGLRASFVEKYTGDLILRAAHDGDVAFVGGFGEAPNVLENYTELAAYLGTEAGVKGFTPILSGVAALRTSADSRSLTLLWGIEPSSYFAMLPKGFVLHEGELLRDGHEGVLLERAMLDDILEQHGVAPKVGDTIVLSARNDVTGTRIREVTIRGIGTFGNAGGPLARISLVDANTLRSLAGLTAVRVHRRLDDPRSTQPLSDELLFGGARPLSEPLAAPDGEGNAATTDYDRILGDTSVREQLLALDNHAWHFLLLDVADGTAPSALSGRIARSNPLGDDVVVEDWRWGAGLIADLAFGVRTILEVIILVTSVVAVIIIMNTLVISVTERITEIGTVRALGGQRSFVRRMITIEVLMITVVFGLAGMAGGCLVVALFNVVGIRTTNLFAQILFGGAVLHPVLSVSSLFTSLLVVTVVGVVASVYPASVALRISPVQAMQAS